MPEPVITQNFDPLKLMSMRQKHEEEPAVKNRPWWLIVLLVIFLLGAGGTVAYFQYFEKIFQPPEKVLAKMVEARAQVTSAHSAGNLTISFNLENGAGVAEAGVISLKSSGESKRDGVDPLSSAWSKDFELSAYGLPEVSLVPTRLNLKFDLKVIGSQIYFRLNELPEVPIFNLGVVRGRWIKFNPSMIAGSMLKPGALGTLSHYPNLFQVSEHLPAVRIEGLPAYHYRLVINREALKAAVTELISSLDPETPVGPELDSLRGVIDGISLPVGEIWIGKKDFLPHRLTLEGNLKNQPAPGGNTISGNYQLDWSFSNYNRPVEIVAPTTFVSAEQIIQEVFGVSLPPLTPEISSTEETIIEPEGS